MLEHECKGTFASYIVPILVVGINPLRIYLYNDGLARFATVPYEEPVHNNLSNMFMHLTNYAINKDNSAFIYNTDKNRDDIGSKRSFAFVLKHIEKQHGLAVKDEVLAKIKDIVIKTLCMAQPHVHHLYRSC